MERKRLFAVLDIDHLMVAWEVAIGRILATPIEDTENKTYPTPSLWFYNNISQAKNDNFKKDLESELQIEKIRSEIFPEKQSRLSGAFFFESYEEAVRACKLWEWESKIDYISEIDFEPSSYVKLDSNWITNEIRSSEKNERSEFIEKYYRGEVSERLEPIYEIICTGVGDVINTELRRKAYEKILQSKPDASLLLALAISCYELKKEKYRYLLRVTPCITENNDGDIEGMFIIDMNLLNKNESEIAKISKRYIHNNGTILITPKLNKPWCKLKIIRPINNDIMFSLVDLSDKFFTMKKNEWEKISS
ncbi:hypothetical protein [Proteus genomosp. 6]|uniref:hypothetical protein n=1 Tax=Proteus genomosp. 6 TaxID=1311820 RepID=UPI000D69CE9B|nr:hypothetical protein [Proteus genomosp. 6]